jgi:hypothetical protein
MWLKLENWKVTAFQMWLKLRIERQHVVKIENWTEGKQPSKDVTKAVATEKDMLTLSMHCRFKIGNVIIQLMRGLNWFCSCFASETSQLLW